MLLTYQLPLAPVELPLQSLAPLTSLLLPLLCLHKLNPLALPLFLVIVHHHKLLAPVFVLSSLSDDTNPTYIRHCGNNLSSSALSSLLHLPLALSLFLASYCHICSTTDHLSPYQLLITVKCPQIKPVYYLFPALYLYLFTPYCCDFAFHPLL